MPQYDFACSECKNGFTVTRSIHADRLEKCELCSSENIAQIIRAPIIIDRTPRTFGSLSEQNSKNYGLGRDLPEKPKKVDMDLAKYSKAELTRYIEDGVRPIGK